MLNRRAALISATLIAGMLCAGAWAWLRAPQAAHVAIHFDALGRANGWGSAARAFFTLPLVAALLWAVLAVLPHIDPRRANLASSARAYGTIWIAVTVVICVQQGSMIARAMDADFPTSRLHAAMIGGLFIVIGNVLGKIRPNSFVGIRTPWTLTDDRVWERTHRFGGWSFVVGGALLLLVAFTAPPSTPAVALTLPVTLAIAAAVTLKSYLLSRERRR